MPKKTQKTKCNKQIWRGGDRMLTRRHSHEPPLPLCSDDLWPPQFAVTNHGTNWQHVLHQRRRRESGMWKWLCQDLADGRGGDAVTCHCKRAFGFLFCFSICCHNLHTASSIMEQTNALIKFGKNIADALCAVSERLSRCNNPSMPKTPQIKASMK